MKLKESRALSRFVTSEWPDVEVCGLSLDSRTLQAGETYIALQSKQSGRASFAYVDQAIERGAVAALLEVQEGEASTCTWRLGVPIVAIPGLLRLLGEFAAECYGYPARSFPIFGVTGTNGKTSTVYFLADILTRLGYRTGSIGTLGSGIFPTLVETGYTTPNGLQLQQQFHQFREAKVDVVVMEVSSHGIAEERIAGVPFAVAGFTNLSQDHLDYHGDMESYASVKEHLFTQALTQNVVINVDDAIGRRYVQAVQQTHPDRSMCVYGLHPQRAEHCKTVWGEVKAWERDGFQLHLHTTWGDGVVKVPLGGGWFQASNIMLVVGMLMQFGVPFQTVLQAISEVKPVPGRMQLVSYETGVIVVDYAHTPDALQQALMSLRAQCTGTLWCVFGCGGNRDALKRPIMGGIAERYADRVVITTDNPRHESPEVIIEDIMKGCSSSQHVSCIVDRREAIQFVLRHLKQDDVLLIAGKGAEPYQHVGDQKIPYSDVVFVKQVMNQQ